MLSRAAASDGSPPPGPGEQAGAAASCLRERPARHGNEVERADGARDVAASGADPGQAERGRGDVVGVGAGTDHVERLGDVGVAAGLAGERQGQLGRQLAGHLPVDRVERALRLGRPAPGEGDQARHPDGAPLPRVVGQQGAHRAVGLVELPGLEGGARAGEQHLRAVRRSLASAARRWTGSSMLTVRSHGICGSPSSVRRRGQVLPVERVVGDGRHVEEQGRRRVLGGALALGGDHLAQHPEQLHPQLVGRRRSGRRGRARTP